MTGFMGVEPGLSRTSLHALHLHHGGRMIPFAGWELPVQYRSIIEEHEAVRMRAGLFDVSHMGQVIVEARGALDALQSIVTNDISRLGTGQGLYTPMCYPSGGIVDDVTVFRLGERRYLLVVNAARAAADFAWITEHRGEATVREISREMSLLALQGPAAHRVLARLTRDPVDQLRRFHALPEAMVAGRRAFVSRTGYTGEDGFEIGPAWEDGPAVWEALLEAGEPEGLIPAGLGARDTLRLEAGFMLYGTDIDETTTPLEAPLGWTVKWDKGDFQGRDALLRQRETGPPRKLVGFTVDGRAIPRQGFPLLHEGRVVGAVTSGTFSPTLHIGIGLGYVPRRLASTGTLDVEVRGGTVPATVVRLPFYRRTP